MGDPSTTPLLLSWRALPGKLPKVLHELTHCVVREKESSWKVVAGTYPIVLLISLGKLNPAHHQPIRKWVTSSSAIFEDLQNASLRKGVSVCWMFKGLLGTCSGT